MDDPGHDQHGLAGLDLVSADDVVGEGLPDHGRGGREQAHGLLDHRPVPVKVPQAPGAVIPAVGLGLEDVGHARVAADQVQGPAQCPRRRLVPRQDEGQDVGRDLVVRQARAVALLVAGAEQGGQQVVRRIAVLFQPGAAARHQSVDPVLEEASVTARGDAAHARNPVGGLQRVQRTDSRPDGQEMVQGLLEARRVAGQIVREQGR
ncbi:hypothetical protein D3C80_1403810 [compost metagenome]